VKKSNITKNEEHLGLKNFAGPPTSTVFLNERPLLSWSWKSWLFEEVSFRTESGPKTGLFYPNSTKKTEVLASKSFDLTKYGRKSAF